MLDWRLVLTAFTTVFLAELGDKTQLATLTLATGARHGRLAVFLGSALALCLTSAIAVAAGEAISRTVSPIWLRRAAGAMFIVLGVLYLVRQSD
jgi:putative Ca2+/H+ antiporter (TMEM165/GDT1 family)